MSRNSRIPDRLDHLLARGRLGGPDREKALEGALAAVAAAETRSWWRRLVPIWGTTALVGTAAAILVISSPLHRRDESFTTKGVGDAPLLEVACADGQRARCPKGGRLLFRVAGARHGGVLAAFAQRVESSGAERIWYFPTIDETTPRIAAQIEPQIPTEGVRLGPEHPVGHYRIYLVLGTRPLTREEIIRADGPAVIAHGIALLEVTP